MTGDNDTDMKKALAGASLDTADAVARAAHIWIHSLCMNELHASGERHALAGGLVAGLCERLELDSRVQELVTYVYALLNDEGGQALAISRMMHDQSISAFDYSAYQKGRSEAAGIVEMLTYHRDRGNSDGSEN
jgi:hypothetical protein